MKKLKAIRKSTDKLINMASSMEQTPEVSAAKAKLQAAKTFLVNAIQAKNGTLESLEDLDKGESKLKGKQNKMAADLKAKLEDQYAKALEALKEETDGSNEFKYISAAMSSFNKGAAMLAVEAEKEETEAPKAVKPKAPAKPKKPAKKSSAKKPAAKKPAAKKAPAKKKPGRPKGSKNKK